MKDKSVFPLALRLIVLNFLEFAVWGAYLTSMGSYLFGAGMPDQIGYFYAAQGFVSIFMPTLMGIVADRWVPAQRVFSFCHLMAGGFMCAACYYGMSTDAPEFSVLFTLYTVSVAFFMPTIALANSVAYNALDTVKADTVKVFPYIRIFGTIGFIIAMIGVDLCGMQNDARQFGVSGVISIVLCLYALTMPNCPVNKEVKSGSWVETLGLQAFSLFKQKKMAIFFIFSFLLGASLQVTNGYANPFIQAFGADENFAGTFGVEHANILISLSQISETLCILLIPFFLKRFGIKVVMTMSMLAWVLRFGLFAVGDPGMPGVILLILSMIVYGVAFDFFNISGSLFVNEETDKSIRSSAQGLFMLMTNGFGATIGTLVAGAVVNKFVNAEGLDVHQQLAGWSTCWYIFAGYALVVAVLFAICFKYKHQKK
ncbi:MAG: MFS transporter [Bacteroidales bacterium]|nr:MFS transporter [Bacteroidales bacterium]